MTSSFKPLNVLLSSLKIKKLLIFLFPFTFQISHYLLSHNSSSSIHSNHSYSFCLPHWSISITLKITRDLLGAQCLFNEIKITHIWVLISNSWPHCRRGQLLEVLFSLSFYTFSSLLNAKIPQSIGRSLLIVVPSVYFLGFIYHVHSDNSNIFFNFPRTRSIAFVTKFLWSLITS